MSFKLPSYCPPSPPVHETRPEMRGSILTSTQPLEPYERLRLWRTKMNIIELEKWKRRTSGATS